MAKSKTKTSKIVASPSAPEPVTGKDTAEVTAPAPASDATKADEDLSARTPPESGGPTSTEAARLATWRRLMNGVAENVPAEGQTEPSYAGLDPEQARLEHWREGMRRQRAQEAREA